MVKFPLKNHKVFYDARESVAYLKEIYTKNTAIIRASFEDFLHGKDVSIERLKAATYPALCFQTPKNHAPKGSYTHRSYGILEEGEYASTLSDPSLFYPYYLEQITSIMEVNDVPAIVGESEVPIPLPYVVDYVRHKITHEQIQAMKHLIKAHIGMG